MGFSRRQLPTVLRVGILVLFSFGRTLTGGAVETPTADMLAAAERIASFLETRDSARLAGAFVDRDVVIIENFAPYLFTGPRAVPDWSARMRRHLDGVTRLRHKFGEAQNFERTADVVFFTLPTLWTGLDHGKSFREAGGWAFVLVRQRGQWRVRSYAWAVTSITD